MFVYVVWRKKESPESTRRRRQERLHRRWCMCSWKYRVVCSKASLQTLIYVSEQRGESVLRVRLKNNVLCLLTVGECRVSPRERRARPVEIQCFSRAECSLKCKMVCPKWTPMIVERIADIELRTPSGSNGAWHQDGASWRKDPS